MTLHIFCDHKCEKCGTNYIPYDDKVPCPKCGLVESVRFDFIHRAVDSMIFNKFEGGSYAPTAWATTSFGDYIMAIIFSLYFSYEYYKPADFQEFAKSYLARINWGNTEYLKDHVLGIALRVHEELTKEK